MKFRSSVMDKNVKAWTFIIWISVSHTLAVHQNISNTVHRVDSTSSSDTSDLQEGSNSLFPFVKPQTRMSLNETRSTSLSHDTPVPTEPTTKLEQSVTKTATFKPISEETSFSTTTPKTTTTTTSIPTTTPLSTTMTPSKTTVKVTTTITKTTQMENKETTETDKIAQATEQYLTTNIPTAYINSSLQTSSAEPRNEITSSKTAENTFGMTSGSTISTKSTEGSTLSGFNSNETSHNEHLIVMNSTANSTELYGNTSDSSRLTHTLADDFQAPDSFWPIALALTISIPTIVVLAITIAVLYRRRIAKPRSLLSMYGQLS